MRKAVLLVLILLPVPKISSAADQVPVGANSLVQNVFDLPGVRRFGDRASYSPEGMTENTRAINAWMDKVATSGREATLYIPNGYIAINGTLGAATNYASPSYNNGQSVRAIPNGMAIVCGGGWAIGRYGALNSWNARTAGFVWGGPGDQPMIRLARNGNILRVNLYGYLYGGSSVVPTTGRCRAGIELWQQPNATQTGHHDISGTFTGFVKGIWCYGTGGTGSHCDHLFCPRLTFRDCLTDFYCDQDQAKNHHFDMLEHYCPADEQSTVFNYQDGGGMTCDYCSLTGDYGATLLITNEGSSNTAYHEISGINIDRGLLNATQAGRGYFRLHEHQSNTPFSVHLRGHMNYGGSRIHADLTKADWQNRNGEPTIVHAPAIQGARRQMTVEVWGLDDVNAHKFQNFSNH